MRWQIEPMDRWPCPDTKPRKGNPFRSNWGETLTLLERELDQLDVKGAVALRVVTDDTNVRQDGMLYARARAEHPGVILSFQSKHGPLSYPCDTFRGSYYDDPPDWQINCRAIALALEALRKVDRYGITGHGEQYTGWRQIEAKPSNGFATTDDALRWLRELTGQHLPVDQLMRAASSKAHPDRHAGDRALWDRVDAARQLLEREESSHG